MDALRDFAIQRAIDHNREVVTVGDFEAVVEQAGQRVQKCIARQL